MKYGIVLQSKLDAGFALTKFEPQSLISEHEGVKKEVTLAFNSIADAEVYAQNHELKNYNIEPLE